VSDEIWPDWYLVVNLIAARCSVCGRIAAHYLTERNENHWRNGGWQRAEGRSACRCDPPPTLPGGADLEKLIARAQRKKDYNTTRAGTTIRVPSRGLGSIESDSL
jgi:hypothetical protein